MKLKFLAAAAAIAALVAGPASARVYPITITTITDTSGR